MKIENILQIAKDLKASDIHITAGVPPKVRVNGQLVNLEMERLMPKDTEELILPLMNVQQRQTFEEKGEVDFSYAMASNAASVVCPSSSCTSTEITIL